MAERLRRIPGVKLAEPAGAFYVLPEVSAFIGEGVEAEGFGPVPDVDALCRWGRAACAGRELLLGWGGTAALLWACCPRGLPESLSASSCLGVAAAAWASQRMGRTASPAAALHAYAGRRASLQRSHPGPAGTWYPCCRYLIECANVALVPGDAFGAPACIRISYAASMETLGKALDRLEAALAPGKFSRRQ